MLNRNTILGVKEIFDGLHQINEIAKSKDVNVKLAIYDGAAMSLLFDIDRTTRDVDVVVHGDKQFVREASEEVAREKGWPEDWMNDAVKGFISGKEELIPINLFKEYGGSGLHVFVPTPEYLFAMKCMAMRIGRMSTNSDEIESNDIKDIQRLIDIIPVKSIEQAFEIVEKFYSAHLITAKTQFGIHEIVGNALINKHESKNSIIEQQLKSKVFHKPW